MNDTFIQLNRRDNEENFDIFLKLNIRPIEMKTKQASERKERIYFTDTFRCWCFRLFRWIDLFLGFNIFSQFVMDTFQIGFKPGG